MARGLIDVFRDWKQNKQDKQELGTETKKEKNIWPERSDSFQ